MRAKPHTEMRSIGPAVMDQIVEKTGLPDNLVETAVAPLVGLPDVETDPPTRELLDKMHKRLMELDPPSSGDGENGGHSLKVEEEATSSD